MTYFKIEMLCCAGRTILGTRGSQGKVPLNSHQSTDEGKRFKITKLISLLEGPSINFT
jgi:hypothetical protein